MPTATTYAAVLATVTTLAAQSVGVTLSALTPLQAMVTDGVVSAFQTVPAGPLWPAPFGGLVATLPSAATNAGASADWRWLATNRYAFVEITHSLHNSTALPTFSGRCGPHEFLVEFTSAAPRMTRLTVSRDLGLAAGAASPTLQIDFGNDGTIDIDNPTSAWNTIHPLSFGPQPLQVRVIVDATLGAQTTVFDRLVLYLEPDNNLVITEPVATCHPVAPPPPPLLQPSFDNLGIDLAATSSPLEPGVVVFGFSAQPALLAMNGALPCILLPSPDVVLLGNSSLNVPLPASVRPATFYVQGVWLTASGLLSTAGYAVQAN